MTTAHSDLAAAMSGLRIALDSFVARDEHLISDAMLHGYALDVLEQAGAVQVLQASPSPRTAYPNARAAFESSEDALLLATSQKYDDDGALAYAIEVVETDELRGRFLAADAAYQITRRPPASMTPAEICAADGAYADELGANGEALRSAFAMAAQPNRTKQHWSGLGRKKILEELARRLPQIEGLAQAGDAFYGFLSVHSHPRLRSWAQPRQRCEDGRIVVERGEVDSSFPAGLAFVAVKLATLALDLQPGRATVRTTPA